MQRVPGDSLTFWATGLLPPVGAFLLNALVRGRQVLRSSGADWALMIFSFDLGVLFQAEQVRGLAAHPLVRDHFSVLGPTLLLLSIVIWLALVHRVEPQMGLAAAGLASAATKVLTVLLGWVLVCANLATHVFVYL